MIMPQHTNEWPVPQISLKRAADFLKKCKNLAPTVIASHSDADGLCSGVLMLRTLQRLEHSGPSLLITGKGEHVHDETFRQKILSHSPRSLIVLDMGSRGEPICAGLPTLLVDHHQPRGFPPGAVVLSSFGIEPVVPASYLAYMLARCVADVSDLNWLALIGSVGDLGSKLPIPELLPLLKVYGQKSVTEAVALLNAARRSGNHQAASALSVLLAAQKPSDISMDSTPGVDALRACRSEVQDELGRCLKVAPKFSGTQRVALLRFSSPAQIHPLIATRWARSLAKYIVIAANDDYLPGRVNFSVRTATGENLVDFLRKSLPDSDALGEFGYGHANATGGSLSKADFQRFLDALGFNVVPQRAKRAGSSK